MDKIFVINAGTPYAFAKGDLNRSLHDTAVRLLTHSGYEVRSTHLTEGYREEEEVAKFLWADAIIYQMPAWWMGAPWTLKKYIDEVFTVGHGQLYASDGRSAETPSLGYGSGGLLQGRKYMISATWNAPRHAFEAEDDFFEGKDIDAVYFPFHKAHQLIGLQALPTFACFDVVKNPGHENDQLRYKRHLEQVFNTR
ncbi:NAD(P)H-dependent oxidoreductase [Pseudomonas sp. MWU12-2345]|uniref:NAD(P)H-dependent oxidoreductase n=1 Tax=Pseudomonas sp. MWU12-2345 TaxID=2928689 RepID=UPI00201074B8|nr:NAD(P)H-dependent oxidoreductase [Pseudomonas sp. MWU12-2345]